MTEEERVSYLAGEQVAIDDVDRAELDRVRGALRDPSVWAEPAPGLEDRIVASIAAAAAESQAPAPTGVVAEPAGIDELAARRRRRWTRYAVAAAAAAAAVVVAVAIGVNRGSEPVQFAASLTGTQLAPSASGDVTLTKTTSGWRITLRAKGLVRRDNGQYYEAWLKSSQGRLVPIGTFNQGDNVTLWSGVPPSEYPTLTVTRQEASGGPASSGQVVLSGPTHQTH
jgi:Anti-sigma-K factor rskA